MSDVLKRLKTAPTEHCRVERETAPRAGETPVQSVVVSCMLVVMLSCGRTDGADQTAFTPPPTPRAHSEGEALFDLNCAACHGTAGTGSEQGPPLVHRIYEPSHHADESFYRAAAFGVRAHHWRFGDMPAVSGIQREQVAYIVGYIRWLQRQAGIE